MSYIERETALKIIDNYAKTVTEDGKAIVDAVRDIVAVITPTADVVEVVRCKDCKFAKHCYGDVFDCTCPITPWASDEYGIFVNANDYCNYGGRREDNEG